MILVYVSALIGLLLTLIAEVPYLDFLKKKMYGQFIREDGPSSHNAKAGTPTMGGIIIVAPAIIAAILGLFMAENITIKGFILLLTFALFCFAGYEDDIKKVTKKQNKGLSAKGKLLIQILISMIPALFMTFTGRTTVSFFDIANINLGIFYPLFTSFVIVGASNAVNLTDGLDGLASGTSSLAFAATAVICAVTGRIDLAIVSAAIAGSCVGFLYFNKYPAKVFMGDTGSLALGGALGTLAVLGKFEIWLIFFGAIFIIETLSVIIQVISFKTTGKRVFKMSPIHHHFELSGWHETKVAKVFISFAAISCILGLVIYLKVNGLW